MCGITHSSSILSRREHVEERADVGDGDEGSVAIGA
jgi:hypothetical protein